MNKRYLKMVATVLTALTLVACGGGGGDGGSTPAPTLPQGLWDALDSSLTLYVLPSAGAAGEVWAIQGGSTPLADRYLVQGSLQVSGDGFEAGAARYLTGDAADAADAQAALRSTTGGGLDFGFHTSAAGTVTVAGMTPSAAYERTATLSDWQGCWEIAGDVVDNQICVSDTGVVTGHRGACVLSGSVGLRTEAKAVVDVSVQESVCAEATNLSGIGVFARSGGTIVEDARLLALKGADGNTRSLIPLTRLVP